MAVVIKTNPDGTFHSITLEEMSADETLVVCKALARLSESEDTHPTDRSIANRIRGDIIKMLEPKPRQTDCHWK